MNNTVRSIKGVNHINMSGNIDFETGGDISVLQIGLHMNLTGLTKYYTKQESDSRYQIPSKVVSASSGNGSCIYNNLHICAGNHIDGKWVHLSAASATPFNGVYSHNWHHQNSSNSCTTRVNNLLSSQSLC